jgi:hypothetical protein
MALTIGLHAQGQPGQPKKNLSYYLSPIKWKTVPKSFKFDLQLDTRNSFIKDYPINVYGVNVGVIFRQRFRAGAGFYWINQNFTDKLLGISTDQGKVLVSSSTGLPITVDNLEKLGLKQGVNFVPAAQQLDLYFSSFGLAYTFYSSRLIDLVIPVEVGYGRFKEQLADPTGNNFSDLNVALKPKPSQGMFVPGQAGFEVITKVHRWAWLETVIGYRYTLYQNYDTKSRATSLDSQFNGMYYIIGVKVQLGTIVKEIKAYRKRKKMNH